MHIYEGIVIQVDGNKYHSAILKLMHDEPGCDTVMEHECDSEEEANIWVDDEMSRLINGKGIWDL